MRCELESHHCASSAVYARHWKTSGEGFPYHITMRTKAMCAEHATVFDNRAHCRIEPLLVITPHSIEHITLEAAFYALACGGVYTAAELAQQQADAKARRRMAA